MSTHMMGPTRELLTDQLLSAVADGESGRDDPFEVAVLAGLLSRRIALKSDATEFEEKALDAARRLKESGVLARAIPDVEQALDAVAQLKEMPADADEEERCEPLFDLDELCAGACFLGMASRYADAVNAAITTVRASAQSFRSCTPWVVELLLLAPPAPEDPALLLWRSVEECGVVD